MKSGYISEQIRARVQAQANHRCGYCLSPQKYILGVLEIDQRFVEGQRLWRCD